MAEGFTTESVVLVWDDGIGTHVYVGPDADGLDLVDIRYVDEVGKVHSRVTIPKEQALLVAQAIQRLYGE